MPSQTSEQMNPEDRLLGFKSQLCMTYDKSQPFQCLSFPIVKMEIISSSRAFVIVSVRGSALNAQMLPTCLRDILEVHARVFPPCRWGDQQELERRNDLSKIKTRALYRRPDRG